MGLKSRRKSHAKLAAAGLALLTASSSLLGAGSGGAYAPPPTGSGTSAAAPIRTDGSELGIAIMGSIVQKNSDENVALIKVASGTVMAVKKDHVISDTYKVVAVDPQFIEIITRDAKTYLVYQDKFNFSGKDPAAPKATMQPSLVAGGSDPYREDGFERVKDKITMTGMYRDRLIKEDLAKVLMQATAEPHLENGQIVGFRISQIDEASIFQKSGLNNDDIVTAINGHELNNVAGSIALLQSLKSAERVEVELRRGGVAQKIAIEVK